MKRFHHVTCSQLKGVVLFTSSSSALAGDTKRQAVVGHVMTTSLVDAKASLEGGTYETVS